MVKKVIVLGGGSAGFMAALALARKLPGLAVTVIRSKDIGVIGVGEGSTVDLTRFLHEYLRVSDKRFFEIANPTWKLGLKFLWGPRPQFYYPFGPGIEGRYEGLSKNNGFYCDADVEYADPYSAMMAHDRAFERGPNGLPAFHQSISYHFENEKFVQFLEGYATAVGVALVEDTVAGVKQDESGVTGLLLASGRTEAADLYVDCSGFVSLLLGKTLREPFVSFKSSLFCDRAVVGGWDRGPDEVIKPYTTCETMDSGWCWQIEHEARINRGYVYASDFISDEAAEREFRAKNPKVGPTRVVRFVSGRYERCWVKNVVAIGNASGFVEPREATALGVICAQGRLLASSLIDSDRRLRPAVAHEFNDYNARNWDTTRAFIAVHYKYNTRLDTPFWRACQADTDLAGAERVVEHYRQNGPSGFWEASLLDPADSFRMSGYLSMLVGQRVPFERDHLPADAHLKTWHTRRQRYREAGARGLTVKEALAAIRSPRWNWQRVAPGR